MNIFLFIVPAATIYCFFPYGKHIEPSDLIDAEMVNNLPKGYTASKWRVGTRSSKFMFLTICF